jgi:hypothetical protein
LQAPLAMQPAIVEPYLALTVHFKVESTETHSECVSNKVDYSILAQVKSTHVKAVGFQKHFPPD